MTPPEGDKTEKKVDQPKESKGETQPKKVREIVSEIYGEKNWKAKMPELAAKFWIKDYSRTAEQNILIWKKLLAWERLEKREIVDVIDKFSPEKQKWLRENDKEIDLIYLTNLNNDNIKNLNDKINDKSHFLGFFRNQKELIDKKKKEVKALNTWANGFESNSIDRAVLSTELLEFDSRLEAFKEKLKINSDFSDEDISIVRKKVNIWIQNATPEEIKENWGKEEFKKQLERIEFLNRVKEKWLDKKYESEFDDLVISLYNIQKDSPWLQKFWNKELLEYTKKKIVNSFDRAPDLSNDALERQKNEILREPIIQDYIKDPSSNLTSLVTDESLKDNEYRASIKEKYNPTLWNIIKNIYVTHKISEEDQKMFDENTWVLKENISSKDKERLEQKSKEIQPLIKEKFANTEWEVLKERNPAIKTQAVSTCIDMLRSCMNFTIDQWDQENLLTSLKDIKSDAIQEHDGDRVLEIKGKIGDKDLIVQYNLTKWTLATQKFLKKDISTWTFYLDDEKNGREDIPFLKLPKLSNFTQKVESRGDEWYKEILTQSKDIAEMTRNIQKRLDTDIKADYLPGVDSNYFEKIAVQNMFTQEILEDFMHFPKDSLKAVWTRNPEYSQLCDLVYNAANWCTKDELKRWRETIKQLKDIKEKNITYDPKTNSREDIKKNNSERYFFEMAFCPYILDKKNYREMPTKNTYLQFFQCFKSDKSDSFQMIDLDMLSDYTSKLGKKINKQEDNTMAWKRAPVFKANLDAIESHISTLVTEDTFKKK